jgi:hypothetical protein
MPVEDFLHSRRDQVPVPDDRTTGNHRVAGLYRPAPQPALDRIGQGAGEGQAF